MTSFMNSPWAAFYVVCCMLSAPVSQCSVYSVFPFPSLWLPPTLPPPATHPMAGCQDPPAATNHRAGCHPSYPLLPPTLWLVSGPPPPATSPSLDINSCGSGSNQYNNTEHYRGYTNKVHYLIIILTHDICPLALWMHTCVVVTLFYTIY